jgi:hypothetical protein
MPSKRSTTDDEQESQPKEARQENQQSTAEDRQPATVPSAVDTSQLLAALTQVFRGLQSQVQGEPPLTSAAAEAAAMTFRDLGARLRLRCPEPPPVAPVRVARVQPGDEDTISLGASDQLPDIVLTFTKELNTGTVGDRSIRVWREVHASNEPGKLERVEGKVTPDGNGSTATFKHNQPDQQTSTYWVEASGDGLYKILDTDGLALDGNSDGSQGGTFVSKFKVEFNIPA